MWKKRVLMTVASMALVVSAVEVTAPVKSLAAGEAVQVWLSNPNSGTWLARQGDVNFASSSANAEYTITVNEGTTYQSMDGFGASLTDSSSWLLFNKLTTAKRTEVMNNLFGASGINISALRQPIGSSDFNWESWTYDDTTNNADDKTLTSFSLWREDAYIRPILNQAYQVNTGRIKIFAAPWSPPAWMKTGKSLLGDAGGSLRTDSYDAYANYLVKYLQQYRDKGTPVYALSVQNEPKFAPHWPGMVMSSTEQINFINTLGPKLSQNGLSTKIMAYDHNYDDINYATSVLNSSAAQYVAGSAFHYYSDLSHPNLTTLHNNFPAKDIWFTEGGSGTWIGGGTDKGMFQDLMMHTIRFPRNWAKSYIMWNVALDQNAGPALSGIDSSNRGLLTIRSDTMDSVAYNPQYYGLGHSSKFVDPNANRIDSNTYQDAVEDVAYKNPDGSKVVILSNRVSSAKTVKMQWGTQSFTYTIPADSAITFKWSGAASSQAAAPVFSPGGGTYSSTQNVTLTSATSGADIRYTTNGTDPTSSSTLYSAPIAISSTTTLKAKAFKAGMADSAVASAVFTISASSGSAPVPGTIYKIISKYSSKALDVNQSSTSDGANVQQWDYTGGTNQRWYLVNAGGGYYNIINVNSGKGLDVADLSTQDGGRVQQWTVSGSGGNNQQWQVVLVSGNYYKIINRNSGKALDIAGPSTANGAAAQQWSYTGGDNQLFSFLAP